MLLMGTVSRVILLIRVHVMILMVLVSLTNWLLVLPKVATSVLATVSA